MKSVITCWILIVLLISSSSGQQTQAGYQSNIIFCWFLSSDATDLGWNYSHDTARSLMGRDLSLRMYRLTNTWNYLQPNATRAQEMIDQGIVNNNCGFVVTVGVNFNGITPNLAQKYPDIKFLNIGGTVVMSNLANAFARDYQGRYLSGIVAGMMTTTNKLGYVAAVNNSQVNRGINAFTLGARSVNENIQVYVYRINVFNNAYRSRLAANLLVDYGCDVITQHVDSNDPMEVASERNVYGIGLHSDMGLWISNPNAILTSVMWNWVPLYKNYAEKILEGTFTGDSVWSGLEDDVVQLAPFSSLVPASVQRLVQHAHVMLLRKDDIFCGAEFEHLTGSATGCLTDNQLLLNVNFFVANVTFLGTITDNPPTA